MVSIENRISYSLRINQTPKLTAFNNLLLDKPIDVPEVQELNEADEIYFGLLKAIQKKDKTTFENYYNKKNKSNPTKESSSPFVNDDFLIFSLIVGIEKFNCDKSWIKNIISIRTKSIITITLENLLNDNYLSKSNSFEIVLMYLQLNKPSLIVNDLINDTFKSIKDNTALFESKSDFHIICSVRAYDLIIELKDAPNGAEISLLKGFNPIFLKRVKRFAWFIQTILLVGLLYGGIKLISIKPEAKVFFDKIGSWLKILGLVGISQLGNIFPFIKSKLYELCLKLFGYPQALIKEAIKKDNK